MRRIASIALLLSACADDGTLRGVRPVLVLDPEPGTALVFGEAVIGRSDPAPVIVEVANRGDSDLIVEPSMAGDEFTIGAHPERLRPGTSGRLAVELHAIAPGAVQGTLTVKSNDPALPVAEYPLEGSAREPCRLSISPPHVVFALDEIHELTVSSNSSHECVVNRILLDRELFEIVDEPALPWTIAAGESVVLRVEHVKQAREPGIPTRELRLFESEGSEAVATLEGEAPLQDCLSMFPSDQLLFPTTPMGQIDRQVVEIRNRCSKEARVLSAVIGTGTTFVVEPAAFPLPVPPLETITIGVEYHPLSELGDRGVLNISTNDATLLRASIELFGQASKPVIAVFPESVDFGSVIVRNLRGDPPRSECSAPSRYVQLYSVGDAQLEIRRLEIDPASDAAFQVTGALVDGVPSPTLTSTIVIPPNKEGRISLSFNPSRTDPKEHQGTLLIHHNAEGSPTRVMLRGSGVDDTIVTDTFTQLDGPRVDILFVVENTFISDDEQQKLVGYAESFITSAEAANADYQIGVTVTDSRSPHAGLLHRCFPHPAILDSDYADQATRIAALECMLYVGVNGSLWWVSGMGAARHTLERALDPDDQDPMTNQAAGFIRPDAKLMIVVVTTRDDESAESNQLLRDYFLSVKGAHRPDRVAVHALAGPVLGPCPTALPFFVRPGYRYFWMANETNGIFYSVCEEDWMPFFDQIGLDVFQPIDEWDLTGVVDPSTLVVSVDGVLVPQDPNDGWTFSLTSNSVRFHGDGLPAPGQEVEISYRGLCRP